MNPTREDSDKAFLYFYERDEPIKKLADISDRNFYDLKLLFWYGFQTGYSFKESKSKEEGWTQSPSP
jgi:hypothetical protein